jgi:hypothetical protein
MSVAACIRAHIFRKPEGTIFTRREMLKYGTSDNIDQTLARMRKKELIVRLACGTYMRPKPGAEPPSHEEIAQARIASLGRKGVRSARSEAHAHRITQDCDSFLTYEVNASTSQFTILPIDGRPGRIVLLKGRVARKMRLDKSSAGRAIKALWYLGWNCTPLALSNATSNFTRSDRAEFKDSHQWMPDWMSNFVHNYRSPKRKQHFG